MSKKPPRRDLESVDRDALRMALDTAAAAAGLGGRDWAVWAAVANRTLGYRRLSDQVTHGVISQMSGVQRPGPHLARLAQAGLIRYVPGYSVKGGGDVFSKVEICVPEGVGGLSESEQTPPARIRSGGLRESEQTGVRESEQGVCANPRTKPRGHNHEGLNHEKTPVVTNARTSESVGAEFADATRAVEAELVDDVIEAELVDDERLIGTGSVNGQAAKSSQPLTGSPTEAPETDFVFGQFSQELTNRAEHAEAAKALLDRLCQIAEAAEPPSGMQPYRIGAASRRKLRGTVCEALGDGRSREVLAVAFGSWLVASGGSGLEGSLAWRIGEATNLLNQHPSAAERGPEALVGLGAGWGRERAQQALQTPAERRKAAAEADAAETRAAIEIATRLGVPLAEGRRLVRSGQLAHTA